MSVDQEFVQEAISEKYPPRVAATFDPLMETASLGVWRYQAVPTGNEGEWMPTKFGSYIPGFLLSEIPALIQELRKAADDLEELKGFCLDYAEKGRTD